MKYMITWCEHNTNDDNLQCAPLTNWTKDQGSVVILYNTKEDAQNAIMETIRDEARNYLSDFDDKEKSVNEQVEEMIQEIHGSKSDFDYIKTELSGVECIYTISKVEVSK